jgi:hypothetical protein
MLPGSKTPVVYSNKRYLTPYWENYQTSVY